METIDLLANAVNILNEYIIIDEDGGLSIAHLCLMDMASAKLEQEGYSQVTKHHVPVWTKDT